MKILFAIILSFGLVACQAHHHSACGIKKSTLCFKVEKPHNTSLSVSLDKNDIESIKTANDVNGIKMLTIILTDKGVKKLNAVLSKNIGERLITYWNDEIINQATIQSTLGKNLLVVLPSANAQRYAHKMVDPIHRF